MVLIQRNTLTRIAGIPVDTSELSALEAGDIVAFRFDEAENTLVAFRMARHEDHKLTFIDNGDYIHLNAAV